MTSYEIRLNVFEGPLDLLLYLIRKNEIDIYDIPMAVITEQYFQYLETMGALNLDIASDYLVMASTLLHIKSRMLLPVQEPAEDGEGEEDPRMELTRQLLEYEAFRKAALAMEQRPILDRDVFARTGPAPEDNGKGRETVLEVTVFQLVEAFRNILVKWEGEDGLELNRDSLSVADRIREIVNRLEEVESLTFDELLEDLRDRAQVICTFLALLELVKMRVVKAFQMEAYQTIRVCLAPGHEGSPIHS
ncbi:MAG TPA: segregation/condensation protein A [Syntrophales bacterium]|nr:segregation/condensation protein A [Syntrophales bacterium]HPX11565.1 segregation/condensation protein A [Syntrophales bacterium]HQB29890.1 segregation/condensation protein A [Syntrophales bacterium]HQN77780.1 segregation/condensation protein A [Syntrophales bacterium]HQQ27847.1 segregation/condensation protein A [Syntrophales bacterium]